MSAILLVEDNEEKRNNLARILRRAAPEARVDEAGNYAEAVALAKQRTEEGGYYDVAVLDVRLPKDGSGGPDGFYPEERRRLVESLSRNSTVINYSTWGDLDEVHRFVNEIRSLHAPKIDVIPARMDEPWQERVARETSRVIYNRRVGDQIDQMLRAGDPTHAGLRFRGNAPGDGTHGIAALMREISQRWELLDTDLQERVKKVFDIRKSGERLLVNL